MNNMEKKALIADVALLIVAIIWGGGFIAAKIALSIVTPFYLLSFRFLFSGLILGTIFFKKIIKIDRRSLISGIILGTVLYVGQTFQTVGLRYTTSGKQSFLTASYAVLVPFASWALTRKKPDIYALISGALTFVGIGFLTLQQNISISYGDFLTIMFTIVYSVQVVLIGIYAKDIDPVHLTTIQLLTAGSLTLISAFIFEPPIKYIDQKSLYGILYLIIFNTTIAFFVQNIAQKYTSDTHASIILSLESVFGCVLSIILMGEIFTKRMVIGCILIFIAVILSKVKGGAFLAIRKLMK